MESQKCQRFMAICVVKETIWNALFLEVLPGFYLEDIIKSIMMLKERE